MQTHPDHLFDEAFEFTLGREGGFVNHPSDPGGATNHGVSLRYARRLGRVVDLDLDGDVDIDDIRLVTPAVAKTLYRKDFWWPVGADRLHPAVAVVAFDTAVLCGAPRAARWMQGAVGATQDGAIGPRSLAALAAAAPRAVVMEVLARRMLRHADDPNRRDFGLGWFRRIAALALFAARYLPPETPTPEIPA
jgi:lysozyme family protein